jgi:hypothetical protein
VKIRSLSLGLCATAAAAGTVCTAQAGTVLADLLTLDLSVPNTVTITATAGLSGATVSGSDNVGVYLQGFFTSISGVFSTPDSGTSTFTSVGAPVDPNPSLYRDDSSDMGLNIYNWSPSPTVGFTAGTRAFTGTAVFNLSPAQYAAFLAGTTSGNLYFPADSADDLSSAALIGTWRVVPTPGAAVLLGLGGLTIAGRRRRV